MKVGSRKLRRAESDARGLRLQENRNAGGGRRQFGRLCGDGELIAMRAQHVLHQKVGASEGVAPDALARTGQERCNRHGPTHAGMWHCWQVCLPL